MLVYTKYHWIVKFLKQAYDISIGFFGYMIPYNIMYTVIAIKNYKQFNPFLLILQIMSLSCIVIMSFTI